MEALERRQYAHRLFPRVRVRRFDAQHGLRLPAHRWQGSGFAADWQSIKETMNSPFSIQVKAFQGDGLSFITPSRATDGKREVRRQGLSQRGTERGPRRLHPRSGGWTSAIS